MRPFTGKSIIVLCDGTGNSPEHRDEGVAAASNVYRLYQALDDGSQFGTRQIAWYDPGVATGTSTAAKQAGVVVRVLRIVSNIVPNSIEEFVARVLKVLEGATAIWIEEKIERGYREIVRHYEPGDRIFLFGFSRGAYTARCIAGVIDRCGLLKSENIRYSKDAVTLYRRRRNNCTTPLLKEDLIHDPKRVHIQVLGLWDTVASLGLPLWGWWFRIGALWRNLKLDSNPVGICKHVYHAMSMDEQRSQFFPTITTPQLNPTGPDDNDPDALQQIHQIWFRGAHADVGGGYRNRCLADLTMEWMLRVATAHDLAIRSGCEGIEFSKNGRPTCPRADPMGVIHSEMERRPAWVFLGAWPRWTPVPRPGWSDAFQVDCSARYGKPHEQVYRRAQRAWTLAGPERDGQTILVTSRLARDGLIFLGVGDVARCKVVARELWNRTGVVFEAGAIYRVSFMSGKWRDGDKKPCGPMGQAHGAFDFVRYLFWRNRRVRKANWLELIGHVAHPRHWMTEEFGLRVLLKLLFRRAPRPLTRSLIRLGRHMPGEGASVYVINLALNGIFYAFANDVWATYKNNTGALEIEIERTCEIDAKPSYAITPRGEVVDGNELPDDVMELLCKRSQALAALQRAGRFGLWPESPNSEGARADLPGGQRSASEGTSARRVGDPPEHQSNRQPDLIPAIDRELRKRIAELAAAGVMPGLFGRVLAAMHRVTRRGEGHRGNAAPDRRWLETWDRDEV